LSPSFSSIGSIGGGTLPVPPGQWFVGHGTTCMEPWAPRSASAMTGETNGYRPDSGNTQRDVDHDEERTSLDGQQLAQQRRRWAHKGQRSRPVETGREIGPRPSQRLGSLQGDEGGQEAKDHHLPVDIGDALRGHRCPHPEPQKTGVESGQKGDAAKGHQESPTPRGPPTGHGRGGGSPGGWGRDRSQHRRGATRDRPTRSAVGVVAPWPCPKRSSSSLEPVNTSWRWG